MRASEPLFSALLVLLLTGDGPAAAQSGPASDAKGVSAASSVEPLSTGATSEGQADADRGSPEGGGSFSYYSVSGATLEARNSATGWDYTATGCTRTIGGTGVDRIMNTELNIPDGSTIKYLRIYYNDTSATGAVSGYLTRYDPGQATLDLASVVSSGSSGYGTALSAEITEVVDGATYSYVLIAWPNESSTALQICGLRVAYISLIVFVDGFESGGTLRWSSTVP